MIVVTVGRSIHVLFLLLENFERLAADAGVEVVVNCLRQHHDVVHSRIHGIYYRTFASLFSSIGACV